MKNKLLIFSATFPPKQSAGSFRLTNICKSLGEDYKIDILTRSRGGIDEYYDKSLCKYINKIHLTYINIGFRRKMILKIIDRINNLPIISFFIGYFGLKRIINRYSLIVCSAPDYGYILPIIFFKKRYILDMRDLWTDDVRKNNNIVLRFLESKLLKKAQKIVVTSPYMVRYLSKYKAKITIINNAYNNKFVTLKKQYTYEFAYTGLLYKGQEEIMIKFLEKFSGSKIVLAGSIRNEFYNTVTKFDNVHVTGIVDYYESLKIQNSARFLLVLSVIDWSIPAKVYDYMKLKRPILGIGYNINSALSEIIKETKSGIYLTVTEFDKMKKKEIVYNLRNGYKSNNILISKYSFESFKNKYLNLINNEYEKI